MAITGTTETCQILVNTPFVLSGLTQTNLSTINITDENGLDVSECFGITTNIIKVTGDNISTTGDCQTSLEIIITEGIVNEVECLYTGYTEQQNGLLLFGFADGTTSDSIHPDCCTALGFDPEIGEGMYYVCRSVPEIDPTDCNNYQPLNTFDANGYMQFEFVTGGTVTTVPSVDCCYYPNSGLVESIVGGQIKCIQEPDPNLCEGYEVVEPVPAVGYITFLNTTTGQSGFVVPTIECCTSLGYSYDLVKGNIQCYNSIGELPTVSFTNDSCCQQSVQTSLNIRLRDCETNLDYNAPPIYGRTYTVGDVIQYIRLNDLSLIRCATVIDTAFVSNQADATFSGTSPIPYSCGDTTHCNIPAPLL